MKIGRLDSVQKLVANEVWESAVQIRFSVGEKDLQLELSPYEIHQLMDALRYGEAKIMEKDTPPVQASQPRSTANTEGGTNE